MAVIIKAMARSYRKAMREDSDPRVADWPLMSSPLPVLIIIAVYCLVVTKLAPAYMKKREPFQLDAIIQGYNVFQIIANGYLAFAGFSELYSPWGKFSFLCEPIDYTVNELTTKITNLIYVYFCLKITDLFETVFFILRKKEKQVTFLHVYHHVIMTLISWIGVKFLAGGSGLYLGTINSLVHCVMYCYYFAANLNHGKSTTHLSWKKYITQLQLFQFASLSAQGILMFIVVPDCAYPKLPVLILMPQNIFMTLLFWDFYRKEYLRGPKG